MAETTMRLVPWDRLQAGTIEVFEPPARRRARRN